MSIEPEIRYVRSGDGVSIATAAIGSGPPLLMMMPTGLGSIESTFAVPEWRASVEEAARHFTFITYDPRGQGLSDRDVADLSLDVRVADLQAVIERLGLGAVYLLGRGLTGPTAIAYTATHPERVPKLALWAAPATPRGMQLSPQLRAIGPIAEVDWKLYCQVLALIDFGWSGSARTASERLMLDITPEMLAMNWRESRRHDASEYLGQIACPTLVIYPKGIEDRVSMDVMRKVAGAIRGATFRTSDAYSLYFGGGSVDTDVVRSFFLEEQGTPPATASGTAIVLFTDIADSTGLTERMGDAAFRGAARALDGRLRAAIREAGGATVEGKTLGDGVLATFASAAQAIAAARRCLELSGESELRLHVGLHAGDVIREDDNVYGGAVNVAARICGLSAPGEILVSGTIRDLARTSAGATFEDRGEHALKGIEEPVRVWAVR